MGEVPAHSSIGEVLSLLQGDFPDMTISKIRFLESQGLIDPERTPSGYRKFHQADIDRLRWILRQQRDHFKPLRVIKALLESGEAGEPATVVQEDLFGGSTASEVLPVPTGPGANGDTAKPEKAAPARAETPIRELVEVMVTPVEDGHDPAAWLVELQKRRSTGSAPIEPAAAPASNAVAVRPAETSRLRFGVDEAAEVTGVEAGLIETLVEFGLVKPRVVGGETSFDAAAIAVIRAAGPLLARGVEARHLRSFKNAADREAGFYEQMILPLLKQRNPEARSRATKTLQSLVDEGSALHSSLISSALQQHFD